jgi:phage FluMu protein Com
MIVMSIEVECPECDEDISLPYVDNMLLVDSEGSVVISFTCPHCGCETSCESPEQA